MKLLLKILAVLLLLLNGVGAVYGGSSLIFYPDGSNLGMPLDWLEHSPFTNYLIPGFILLFANGIFSFAVLIALILNHRKYPLLVMLQGAILTGWILIQLLMVLRVHPLHFIMGGTGLLLILSGWALQKMH